MKSRIATVILAAVVTLAASPAFGDASTSSLGVCYVSLAGLVSKSDADADAPNTPKTDGQVKLTPDQFVAVLNYIGAPVTGGYATGGRAIPAHLDGYGDITGADGKLAPTFAVLKKVLGTEIETNEKFARAVDTLVEDVRKRPGDEHLADAEVAAIVSTLSPDALNGLKAKGVSPTAAVANLVALRSAMTRLSAPIVRGVLNTEVGFGERLPKVGEPVAFSSAEGSVMSTNPAPSAGDSIAYGLGKIARMNDSDPNKGKAKVFILEYSQLDVEGVSIDSLGTKAVDAVEAHLKTGNNANGDTWVDPTVVVSRNEIIASPKEDLVVVAITRDPSNPNVYRLKMGPKRTLPKQP